MTLDIIFLVLLCLSALGGWKSGALSMLASVVVLVASLLLASALATKVGDFLHWGPHWAWPVIGFFLSFLILMIAGGWLKNLFRPKHGLLRSIDGLLGAILGLARGTLLLGLMLALLLLLHLPPESMTQHSHLYPLLLKVASIFITVLRPYLHVPGSQPHSIVV